MASYSAVDQVPEPLITLADYGCKFFTQLGPPSFEIFNQQRVAFDAGHNSGHDQVTKHSEEAGDDYGVKPEHQDRGQQSPAMTAAVNQKHYACQNAEVDVRQQPISQRPGASSINRLARRISHHRRDPHQAHQTGNPTHRQPGPAKLVTESVSPKRPGNQCGDHDYQTGAGKMPGARNGIALMDVASNGVRLIAKHEAQRLFYLAKIFLR